MDAQRVKCEPGNEEVLPFFPDLDYNLKIDDGEIWPGFEYAPTKIDETEVIDVVTPSDKERENSANDQKAIFNENWQAGTLQHLGVGHSHIEVQGNGINSVLNIVTCAMHDVNGAEKVIEAAEELEKENMTEVVPNVTHDHYGVQPQPLASINLYYCSNCCNSFRTTSSLTMHVRSCLRQDKPVPIEDRQCKVCGKVYASVASLKRHIKYNSIHAFRCIRCLRTFSDGSLYSTHMDWHKRQDELLATAESLSGQNGGKKFVVKDFTCYFCKKDFTVVFDQGQEKCRYTCDTCREKYTNVEAQGQRVNQRPIENKCDLCSRVFVRQGFFQRHLAACDGTIKRRRDMKKAPPKL